MYQEYRKAVEKVTDIEPDIVILAAAMASAVTVTYVGLLLDLMLGGFLMVIVFDFAVGYPMYKRTKRIKSIERTLPTAFMQMATTLEAGGTIGLALEEITKSDYGPLTDELKKMMKQVKKGKSFIKALREFGVRTESKEVMRSVEVIISAKKSGGGLVDALQAIADDLRKKNRLIKEREGTTMVQVLFIIIASCVISPFIFGLVSGIIVFLGSIGETGTTALFNTIVFYFKGYLVVSAVFSALAASMIREGRVDKAVVYAPVLILITYVIFVVVRYFAGIFFAV